MQSLEATSTFSHDDNNYAKEIRDNAADNDGDATSNFPQEKAWKPYPCCKELDDKNQNQANRVVSLLSGFFPRIATYWRQTGSERS